MKEQLIELRRRTTKALNDIVHLNDELRKTQKELEDTKITFFNDVIDQLDIVEQAERNAILNNVSPDQILEQLLKVKQPLINILNKYNIYKMEYPVNQLPECSEIYHTVIDATKPNGALVSIMRDGYARNGKIIRKSVLIVVKNN
ncbi:MAG: nucleotide exchange factor GrpE [Saprospiraceae bacterium]|nr:nucleotide exchange factor GrpE [Saprospiraceae bacterium]